jgi:hypothetical protein
MNENNTEIENVESTENLQTEGQLEASEEQQMEASAETEAGENAEAPKEKAPAAWLSFVAAVEAHANALGLSTKDQKSFFQVFNATTSHKLYVAKQDRGVKRIDTTLPMSALGSIAYDLEKPNGRIACHVLPTAEAVTEALNVLATFGDKIPAPKSSGSKKSAETPAVEAVEESSTPTE